MKIWGKKSHLHRGEYRHVPSCPITRGQPTTMLTDTFLRVCARQQEDAPSYCSDVCRGDKKTRPAELQLIGKTEMNEMIINRQKETEMANRKNGKCTVCGQEKNCNAVYGRQACSTCAFIIRAVKLTPETVIKEIQQQHGDKYIAVEGTAEDNSQIVKLNRQLFAA